jgi:hypothetical protein
MNNYLITISFEMPYPKKHVTRQAAGSFSTAVSRAIKEWRRDYKGKKVKELTVRATKL